MRYAMLLMFGLCAACATRYKPGGVWIYGGASRSTLEEMPRFPWPPKQFTGYVTVPDRTLVAGSKTLGDIVVRFRRWKLNEPRFFTIGDDGFAVVTGLRCIDDDGRLEPRQGDACLDANSPERAWFSFDNYISALLGTRPGRYRMIALVVSPHPIAPARDITFEDERRHYSEGAVHLPQSLAAAPVTGQTRATILVYEFLRESYETDSARLVKRSRISAVQHIEREGLVPKADLL
jgi:hypothetical protein